MFTYYQIHTFSDMQPLFFVFIGCFLLRFPHEYLHKWAAQYYGIDSRLALLQLNATCTPVKEMNTKQLVVIALAPLVVLSLGLIFLLYLPLFTILKQMIVGVLVYHILSCYGDVLYVVVALRYRATFRCLGTKLEVYQ